MLILIIFPFPFLRDLLLLSIFKYSLNILVLQFYKVHIEWLFIMKSVYRLECSKFFLNYHLDNRSTHFIFIYVWNTHFYHISRVLRIDSHAISDIYDLSSLTAYFEIHVFSFF